MATTRSFKELVQGRVARDPEFAAALLREGVDAMLSGGVDAGKSILRDYIRAAAKGARFRNRGSQKKKSRH